MYLKTKLNCCLSFIIAGLTTGVAANKKVFPNVVFVLADEWRAQDLGYNGNKDVQTPNLDILAKKSFNFSNAISCCAVSTPYRASLLTGQYPLTNGVFVNDVQLNPEAITLGKVFGAAGYETAYIGKWHLDGNGRKSFIPKERRQGFDYWKVLECDHDYYNSYYWDNDDKFKKWDGYDAFAQTNDAVKYITEKSKTDKPFMMILSWGPPHTPFHTAPEEYKDIYNNKQLSIRSNVPDEMKQHSVKDLIGYYGHITALDSCIGVLQKVIQENGLDENTIFIFTSDHGHLVRSHATEKDKNPQKQQPYAESVNVPLLIRYPKLLGDKGFKTDMLINTPDLMPTLLGLCGIKIPETVEGINKTGVITGQEKDTTKAALIACYHPFGQWSANRGGKEYRGVVSKRYTYVKDLEGDWLLFDNKKDPFQLNNLVHDSKYKKIKDELEHELNLLLNKTNDKFEHGMEYIKRWGYIVDKTGTVPYWY